MVKKIPPPPPIANRDPTFNRWLLELTGILNSGGDIDPNTVDGLPEVILQSGENADAIVILQTTTGSQGGDITSLQNDVTALQGEVVAINAQLTTLGARGEVLFGAGAPAAGLGKVKDWYGDLAGAVGARVWIKTAVATWTPFPF